MFITLYTKKLLLKLSCFCHSHWIQFFSKQMQTILYSRWEPKTSIKTAFFHYSRWKQNFSKQMQNDTLLRAPKTSNKT